MYSFNPDGSIKLPDSIAKDRQDKEQRLKTGKCAVIRKEMVNFTAPKKCILHIKLSDAISDGNFILAIHNYFCADSEVPSSVNKLNEKEFNVEIGTHFKRCSDCTKFVNRVREFLDDNVIEEKGNCPTEQRTRDFSYEDHFE